MDVETKKPLHTPYKMPSDRPHASVVPASASTSITSEPARPPLLLSPVPSTTSDVPVSICETSSRSPPTASRENFDDESEAAATSLSRIFSASTPSPGIRSTMAYCPAAYICTTTTRSVGAPTAFASASSSCCCTSSRSLSPKSTANLSSRRTTAEPTAGSGGVGTGVESGGRALALKPTSDSATGDTLKAQPLGQRVATTLKEPPSTVVLSTTRVSGAEWRTIPTSHRISGRQRSCEFHVTT
eukprot:336419-Pleurochrysis_carterae.AAC.2